MAYKALPPGGTIYGNPPGMTPEEIAAARARITGKPPGPSFAERMAQGARYTPPTPKGPHPVASKMALGAGYTPPKIDPYTGQALGKSGFVQGVERAAGKVGRAAKGVGRALPALGTAAAAYQVPEAVGSGLASLTSGTPLTRDIITQAFTQAPRLIAEQLFSPRSAKTNAQPRVAAGPRTYTDQFLPGLESFFPSNQAPAPQRQVLQSALPQPTVNGRETVTYEPGPGMPYGGTISATGLAKPLSQRLDQSHGLSILGSPPVTEEQPQQVAQGLPDYSGYLDALISQANIVPDANAEFGTYLSQIAARNNARKILPEVVGLLGQQLGAQTDYARIGQNAALANREFGLDAARLAQGAAELGLRREDLEQGREVERKKLNLERRRLSQEGRLARRRSALEEQKANRPIIKTLADTEGTYPALIDPRTGTYSRAQEAPPYPGARQAPDGNWYVMDENGKYRQVQ